MSVAIEGFTAFICFAAGHEIIRQHRRDLTLIRMTPDLIYDQMIAAGVASKLIFSYLGNPGVGALHCVRRAVETGRPVPLELEEYSHYGLVGRYIAGATKLPFYPLRSYLGSEMPLVNDQIKFLESPYGDEKVAVVPPLHPDIAILHAVDEAIIRADPNRTLIPGLIVDAVVHLPYGAYPSYVQGYYDRDNAFYLMWDKLSRDPQRVQDWLDEWVYSVEDHTEYLRKLGTETLERIQPGSAPAACVEYGAYQ